MSPLAAPKSASPSTSVVSADKASLHAIKASPFGASVDPHLLKDSVYTSANSVISQALYSVSTSIFSYETPGAENLVDAHAQLWAGHFRRTNAFGVVPLFHRFQPRNGALGAVTGYARALASKNPHSVILGANALPYMQQSLASAKVPLSLFVSAVDSDSTTDALVSNYAGPVTVARAVGAPVVTPVSADAAELQHMAVLTQYLAQVTKNVALNVFDGPEFARTYARFTGVQSVDQLGDLYSALLSVNVPELLSPDAAIKFALGALNKAAGTNYNFFEYDGAQNPETVFVVYGSFGGAQVANVVSRAAAAGAEVGVVRVRVPFPFLQSEFVAAIPSSARRVVALSPTSLSFLRADATLALFAAGRFGTVSVDEFQYPLNFVWSPITVLKLVQEYADVDHAAILAKEPVAATSEITANTSPAVSTLVWARDNSDLVGTVRKLALSLSLDETKQVSVRTKFDTSVGGGVAVSQLVCASRDLSVSPAIDSADIVLVEDASIFLHFDVLATARPGATVVLVNHKKISTNVETDVVEKLPVAVRRSLAKNHLKLLVVDFSLVEDLDAVSDSTKGFSADFLAQIAFWRASLPELGGYIVNKLLQANGDGFELLAAVLDKFVATVDEKAALKPVEVVPEWALLEDENEDKKDDKDEEKVESVALPFFPNETSFFPNPRVGPPSSEETALMGVSDLAQKIAFPEAYSVSKELRPDLPVKNFVVKVKENKRLTPAEYSRNIFHIEFDITGTGLKYEIGEALGIHGRNNLEAVDAFLEFYGVDGDSLVEVSNKDDPSFVEIRSARQALQDNVDFLGKPPKRFYESLAPFANDEKEKAALEKLASGDGAEELKKRQEVDFASYWDILEEFKSAKPSFDELVKIIAPLKRREYSIASSQKMHPNAVHLLIVVVDWIDSKDRTRFGHCSKYLADLKIGDELVVSVKPSVMKLPKLPEQPIVMSGLGTGLAPFKAFIEEKIWQQAQGNTIGEIYLYMGSRHKKEEYLYGELWEAYKKAGVLTHIGAAFSRDQPQKIYIQDKIRSSIEELTDAIVSKNGSFYLCGPTWPVPDITACLEDIVRNGAKREGKEIKDVAKVVEDMKEDGRYILEVY